MVTIYRFSGVRPDRLAAPAIAAVPYDVVTADEATGNHSKKSRNFFAGEPSGCRITRSATL